jgi:hypothetical protein
MPSRSSRPAVSAPGEATYAASAPPHERQWPRLDDRLVTPEGREEVINGRRVYAAPANPEHGDPHLRIDAVIATNLKPGYVGSTDMLTRSALKQDFASDTSVRREGINPLTKERYLEELVIEVVNTQGDKSITDKAAAMTERGVRRVLGVFVREELVCEWRDGGWVELPRDGLIEDVALAAPLPVRALLEKAAMGEAAVQGLIARKEPAMLRALTQSEQRGEQRGELRARRASLRAVASARGFTLTSAQEALVDGCDDAARLDAWLRRVATAASIEDAIGA